MERNWLYNYREDGRPLEWTHFQVAVGNQSHNSSRRKPIMKKTAMLGLGLMLFAGSAMASNTGFKLNFPLLFGATGSGLSNNNWLSLPYFYFPNGNVGQFGQNSIDLCRDLNGGPGIPKVTQVISIPADTDKAKVQSCSSSLIKVFDLKQGEGYSVKPVTSGITIDIVGSHDDLTSPNKTPAPATVKYPLQFSATGLSNNNWFSVPYHSKANNSLDMCAELKALTLDQISQVIQIPADTDKAKVQSCASTAIKVFDLIPGQAYSVKPKVTGISIGMDVY
jgi:hypothetical protein